MVKNREYALKKKSIAPGETDKALNKLEESYLENNGNKFQHKMDFGKLNEQSVGLEGASNSSPNKNVQLPKIWGMMF